MNGVNLHAVVRGAIESIHPDEECTLYQAIGQKNIRGVVMPVYKEPQTIRANIQPLDTDALTHLDGTDDTSASEQAFLYSDDSFPVAGIRRFPTIRSGDFIKRADGTWYLVTSVIEDWSANGWANVGIKGQVTPPDFSASGWSDDSNPIWMNWGE